MASDAVNDVETPTSRGYRSTDFPVMGGPDRPCRWRNAVIILAPTPCRQVNAAGQLGLRAFSAGARRGQRIAVDSAGNAYVTGKPHPPTSRRSLHLTYNGIWDSDVFVAKVNAAGTSLVYAGFLGGSSSDSGKASRWTARECLRHGETLTDFRRPAGRPDLQRRQCGCLCCQGECRRRHWSILVFSVERRR